MSLLILSGGGLSQTFRATNGKALVWGKPPQYITAKYTTSTGQKKSSLLLHSGWCVPRCTRPVGCSSC
jgi:hypothetical protein